MTKITNEDLLQAINKLSGESKEIKNRLDGLETRISNVEVALLEFKSEVKQDLRKLDKKFTIVLEDLLEARTDITLLQQAHSS